MSEADARQLELIRAWRENRKRLCTATAPLLRYPHRIAITRYRPARFSARRFHRHMERRHDREWAPAVLETIQVLGPATDGTVTPPR